MQPRIRTVKPDLFMHETLFDAERDSGLPLRLAYIGLFAVADREGRFKWRPRLIKHYVLPNDDLDFADVLNALAASGFIVKYVVDGEEYGVIPTFSKHQRVNTREAKSDIPAPPDNAMHVHASATHVQDNAMHVQDAGEGEGEGEEEGEWEKTNLTRRESADTARARDDAPPLPSLDDVKPTRAGQISLLLRRAGMHGCVPANPVVQAWAADPRVTDEILTSAAQLAIDNKASRPNPAYLRPIVAELIDPPPPRPTKPRDDWFRSNDGITRKASELGLRPREGESYASLRERCDAAIRNANGHRGHA